MFNKKCLFVSAALTSFIVLHAQQLPAQDASAAQSQATPENIRTIDYLVPHISTVPANAGNRVELFVREKVQSRRGGKAPVVLMIHGATISAVPDFDLPFENYSWMEYLGNAGFDVFALDLTGYGLSPRPMMDNPCNTLMSQQQQYLNPNPLSDTCSPTYPFQLTSVRSDSDEIDRVVDYIRNFRNADRVNLVAWSAGGIRAAYYAGLHPEKIDKMLLYAPGTSGTTNYNRLNSDDPPQPLPLPGVPTTILGANDFHAAWDTQVSCPGQYAPGIRPVITQTMLDFDPLGSTWGTNGVRRAPNLNISTPLNWGLNMAIVSKIMAPTLVIRGDLDQTVLCQVFRRFTRTLFRCRKRSTFTSRARRIILCGKTSTWLSLTHPWSGFNRGRIKVNLTALSPWIQPERSIKSHKRSSLSDHGEFQCSVLVRKPAGAARFREFYKYCRME